MNKLFTKIAAAFVGMAMAIGVGVAVGASAKEAAPVRAATSASWAQHTGTVTAGEYLIVSVAGTVCMAPTGSAVANGGYSQIAFTNSSAPDNGFTFVASGTDFKITDQTSETTYYVYASGTTNNGLRNGTSASQTGSTWTITETSTSGEYTIVSETSRQISLYSTSNWRSYGNTSGSKTNVKLFKKNVTYTVTYTAGDGSGSNYVVNNVSAGSYTLVDFGTAGFTAPTGKQFKCWSISSIEYNAGASYTVAGNTTVTALYEDLPTDPFIMPSKTSVTGVYTGQNETVPVTYGNLTTGLAVSSNNTSVVDASIDYDDENGNADILLDFNGAGSTSVSLKDGSTELATISVSVTASSVTITGMPSTGSLSVGGTLNLGSQITVTAVGSYSNSVTWTSGTTSVATVSNTGVVTGVGLGTSVITVASVSDSSVTASCTVTVALLHTYNFGTTASSNQLNDINGKYSYTEFSGETTLFGTTGNCIRMSTGSAIGSFVYTLGDTGAYITKVTLSVKAWSASETPTLSVTPNGGNAVTHTYTDNNKFVDYSFAIPASGEYTSVTIATTAAKRAYLSGMSVEYAYKDPEITTTANNFEIATSGSQNIELEFVNYATTPTVTYEITSGSSSVSSVTGFDTLVNNVATVTITASSTTGTGITIRFTGTAGSQTTYIDITFDVIAPKTITDLIISTAGTTTFTEGDAFSVGPLVLTATFSDSSTTVYSAANDNLGLLTFDPAIGDTLTASTSVTVYVTAYGDDVFQMYDITVNEKPYATQVTSVTSLWDGQEVYFADQSATRVSAPHTGGNNLSSVAGSFVNGKGLSINDTTGAQVYTVGRVLIDSTTYYTFSFVSGSTRYYLSDTGTSSNNWMGRITLANEDVTTLDDTTSSCAYWTISISDGVASITSKSNTNKPSLRWNSGSSIFSCYISSGTQTDPVLYAVNAYSANSVAADFASGAMHMDDYESQSGYCKDVDHNYYANAKRVWNAMTADERSAVVSSQASAYARLDAWASANGDILNSNNVLAARVVPSVFSVMNGSISAIIIIVSMISITAIGGYFFIRKRKEQ